MTSGDHSQLAINISLNDPNPTSFLFYFRPFLTTMTNMVKKLTIKERNVNWDSNPELKDVRCRRLATI